VSATFAGTAQRTVSSRRRGVASTRSASRAPEAPPLGRCSAGGSGSTSQNRTSAEARTKPAAMRKAARWPVSSTMMPPMAGPHTPAANTRP
jgi:hypothetical protein